MASREPKYARAVARDEQRDPAVGRRQEDGVGDPVEAAGKRHCLATKQRNHDLQRLLQAADAVVGRVAERLVLGVVPARAETEHEAAAADRVGRDRHLGEEPRDSDTWRT